MQKQQIHAETQLVSAPVHCDYLGVGLEMLFQLLRGLSSAPACLVVLGEGGGVSGLNGTAGGAPRDSAGSGATEEGLTSRGGILHPNPQLQPQPPTWLIACSFSSHTLSWVVSTWEFHLKKKGKVFLLLLNNVIILHQCSRDHSPWLEAADNQVPSLQY